MSETNNTLLYERAAEAIDYFEEKLPAQLIEQALDSQDLERLAEVVTQAEAEISRQEVYANDCY